MTRPIATVSLLAMAAAVTTTAFVPGAPSGVRMFGRRNSAAVAMHAVHIQAEPSVTNTDLPFYAETTPAAVKEEPVASPLSPAEKPMKTAASITTKSKPKKAGGGKHKEGVFSPAVKVAKDVIGDAQLNKIRAKAISLHSDVIKGFVQTSDTNFGQAVLKTLFRVADRNGNGQIEEQELLMALQTLGFDWIKEKQLRGIFARADKDDNGLIDFQEWMQEAPKTLKTNLTKLAKKNGGDMGLLV